MIESLSHLLVDLFGIFLGKLTALSNVLPTGVGLRRLFLAFGKNGGICCQFDFLRTDLWFIRLSEKGGGQWRFMCCQLIDARTLCSHTMDARHSENLHVCMMQRNRSMQHHLLHAQSLLPMSC